MLHSNTRPTTRARASLLLGALALGTGLIAAAPADAFWKRSRWAACNEAGSDFERARLACSDFVPAYPIPTFSTPAGPYEPAYRLPARRETAPIVRRLG